MISIRDSVEIHTSANQVFNWLERMPHEYKSWHPDHISCRVLHGSMFKIGSKIECEEYLHGKRHSLRFKMTKVVPGKRVEFVIEKMGNGAFEVQESNHKVWFVAELDIGSGFPLLGSIIDLLFTLFFRQRIDAMRQHMTKEGENLKAILESGY
jgi:hypothetical protein